MKRRRGPRNGRDGEILVPHGRGRVVGSRVAVRARRLGRARLPLQGPHEPDAGARHARATQSSRAVGRLLGLELVHGLVALQPIPAGYELLRVPYRRVVRDAFSL